MLLRNDSLWKGVLEEFFADFLRFFYPNANEIFDFNRKFEFLDKELGEIFPNANDDENIKFVDKLVKVWRKNGKTEYILIHIGVQGNAVKYFAKRMFTYYYLILHKFDCDITAWAIFTDTNKKFNPSEYRKSTLNTELVFSYNTYKVIEQDEKTLEHSNNPFASIILTVLLALKRNKMGEVKIRELKFEIFKNLYKKGFSTNKIRGLTTFLNNYVRLNDENTRIFESKIKKFTGKTDIMGLEQQILEQERKVGIKEGISLGIPQGISLGEDNKTRKFIRNAREVKNYSIEVISELVELTPKRVREILDEMGIL